jgi:hypothetical protein
MLEKIRSTMSKKQIKIAEETSPLGLKVAGNG